MRSHASAPLQALYRVFVQPSLPPRTRPVFHTALTKPAPQRLFTTSPPRAAATRAPEVRTQLWNEEIWARRVAVVDPVTKSLQPPERTSKVLQSIDLKTHRLVCVTAPPGPGDKEEWIPTCKIVDKKVAYQAEKAKVKARAQAKKNSADTGKMLELNWAIDANDLGHRMKRMQEFLAEGKKVEIVLARKKGGRKATLEECDALVKKIVAAAEEVGGKQLKPLEGKMAAMASLTFEGSKAK